MLGPSNSSSNVVPPHRPLLQIAIAHEELEVAMGHGVLTHRLDSSSVFPNLNFV